MVIFVIRDQSRSRRIEWERKGKENLAIFFLKESEEVKCYSSLRLSGIGKE